MGYLKEKQARWGWGEQGTRKNSLFNFVLPPPHFMGYKMYNGSFWTNKSEQAHCYIWMILQQFYRLSDSTTKLLASDFGDS